MAGHPAAGRGRLWLRRSAWLIGIWTVSVVALAIVAMLFRVVMSFAGLTP
jgi:Protein of unknown function (DUF2474)